MSQNINMSYFVKKRSGKNEKVHFDKITSRIEKLCYGLDMNFIEPTRISMKVIDGLYSGISTVELDNLATSICADKGSEHPDFLKLAGRIFVSNLHKETPKNFSEAISILYNNEHDSKHMPIVNKRIYDTTMKHKDAIDSMLIYDRDYLFSFFGLKTLEKAYLLRAGGKIIERPQHLLMRVSISIHGDDLDKVYETYEAMSNQYFIHATPTLFNAGTEREGLSSCFLLSLTDKQDSIEGIYDILKEAAIISKYSGGIGISIHDIRAKGSLIHSTNGKSEGIIPMLGVFNKSATYVTQASKRPGSIAIYLEPWHPEIEEFLKLKEPTGTDEFRARDLFYALWINDLFMKRVKNDEIWSLMCPNECPGLPNAFGDEFEKLYTKYEQEGRYRKQIKATDLFYKIMQSQIRTGVPYMAYKDHVNSKNNQANLGTIRTSNLCVAPETKILTKKGYEIIKDLKDTHVEVWNGKQFSSTIVRQTSNDSELMKITFSNGSVLECTLYHKFLIKDKNYGNKKVNTVEAKDLKIGNKLIRCNFPIIYDGSDKNEFKYPYTAGFFAGDGTYGNNTDLDHKQCGFQKVRGDYCMRHQSFQGQKSTVIIDDSKCHAIVNMKTPQISLYGVKKDLIDYIEKRYHYGNVSNGKDIIVCQLPYDMPDKFDVPINHNMDTKLRYFEGICDADGCTLQNNDNITTNIQICSIHNDYLNDLKYMLQTMGVDAKVTKSGNERKTYLPNGHGSLQEYNCKSTYRLLITSSDIGGLVTLGFKPKRLQILNTTTRISKHFIQVTKIEYTGRRDKTFCFTEPLANCGIFNGVLTKNCAEIVEYTDENNTSVCNLGSLGLPVYVKTGENGQSEFDHQLLHDKAKIITKNLDKVIDITHYPVDKARYSNMKNRPIGLGVSGLADTFIKMGYAFDSPEAKQLNKEIFETIYYSALEASCELAQEFGTYDSYEGSGFSKGKFQWDLWEEKHGYKIQHSGRWDWEHLRKNMLQHGMRNSLLTAVMPTASTAILLGNSECIEPRNSHIYKRQTLSGEYQVVNRYLLQTLCDLKLWTPSLKNKIMQERGSIKNITEIPQGIRDMFKVAWDIPQKVVIDLSADRGPYIDQSQSLNIFYEEPSFDKLSKMHIYGWEKGLKTGMYYLRQRVAAAAIQISVSNNTEESKTVGEEKEPLFCSIDNPDCLSCSG